MEAGDSEQEGDDGHAQGWVVSELLQVAAVLALGPNGHLDEAHQREEGHCRAEQRRWLGRVHGTEWGRAQLRGEVGSPGRHCVMMAKPIQDPTCGHRVEMRAGQLLGVGGGGLHAPQPSTATSPALHNSQPPGATVCISRCSQVQTAKATAEPGNPILPHSPPRKCWRAPGPRPLFPGLTPSHGT